MLVIKKYGSENLPDIDWNNPRVICIAESYSKFDIDTLEVIPLRLELYKFRYYQNNIFALDKINGEDEKAEIGQNTLLLSVANSDNKQNTPNGKQKAGNDNLQILFEKNLTKQLNKAQHPIKELFFNLESKIFGLDENIYKKVNTNNIGFRLSKMFAEVHIQKDNILIYLRAVEYNDPLNKVFKVPETHGWVLSRGVRIHNQNDLKYAISLIERSYQDIL